jgi:hypothetical protein
MKMPAKRVLRTDFVACVILALAGLAAGRPQMRAQDVPGEFAVEEATVSGEGASVVVHGIWNPGTEYESMNDVKVSLRLVEGQWHIADVACGR